MSAISKLEKQVADHNRTVDRLTTEESRTLQVEESAGSELQSLLLDEGADAKAIASTEKRLAAARLSHDAVVGALSVAKARAENAERELANAKEQTKREQRAKELREQASAIESAHAAVIVPLEKLVVALKAAPSVFAADEAGRFLEGFLPQLANSVSSARAELEQQAVMSLSGSSKGERGASVVGIGLLKMGVR
jgi:hypothetical protein